MYKPRAMRHTSITITFFANCAAGLFTASILLASSTAPVLAQGSLIRFQEIPESVDGADKEIARRVNPIVDKLERTPPSERGALIPILLEALPTPQKGKEFPWVVASHSLDFGFKSVDPQRDVPVRSALIKALLGKNAIKAALVLQRSMPANSAPLTQPEIDSIFPVPENAPVEVRVCEIRLLPMLPEAYHERVVRYMMKVLATDGNPEVLLHASNGLSHLIEKDKRFDKELVPLLDSLAAKSTGDPLVRSAAISMRMDVNKRTPSPSPLQALVRALASPDKDVQGTAIYSIGELRAQAGSSLVLQLCHYLKNPGSNAYPGRDQHILSALEKIGPAAAAAVPTLIWYLKEYPPEHFDGQGFVAAVLASIGPAAAPACPELIKLLQNGRPLNRLTAANALGKIGPKAASALPALRKACTDTRNVGLQNAVPQAQEACKQAIKKIEVQ